MQLIHQNYATIFSHFSVYHSIALYAVLVLFKFIIAGLLLARKIPEETPRVKPAMTTAVFIMNHKGKNSISINITEGKYIESNMYVCMYACMYACMYVCKYV